MKLRARFDLEIYPQSRRSKKIWVIKDPIALRYFQLRDEEFAILNWLDGRSTLDQIKQRFEKQFAPRRITTSRLTSFIAGLHRKGLVISDSAGQGEQMLIRHRSQRRDSIASAISNPLAIRFRGIDPQPILDWLYPKIRGVYSPAGLFLLLTVVLTAITLVLCQVDVFRNRLPELNALLSPGNLIWLGIALAMTKLLHEFGHALTCKHYGGECHEMGVMLLVFTPCLYCNVTDAWKLSSRFQRIMISAAGILVEVFLASVCVILWWFSQPGLLNTICLNVMVICSIGTVLLNGNPLLRYDGYYILSDVLDMPNLWQDARSRLNHLVMRWTTGFDDGRPLTSGDRQAFLLIYAVASLAYRIIVMASILYLVYCITKPVGLGLIAQLLSVGLIVGILSTPFTSLIKLMKNPILRRKVKTRRLFLSGGLLFALIAACFFVPLPCRIEAPALIEPLDARRIYVSVPGTLSEAVSSGDEVAAGQQIARLENLAIDQELASVRGQLTKQQLRINNLESLRNRDEQIGAQLPAAKEILADLQEQLWQLEKDRESLTLVSPISGTILPPPRIDRAVADSDQLDQWSGTPLDETNQGALLERKTLFCLVGPPDQFEASVYIEQSDLQYVQAEQRVRLLLDLGHGQIISGTVTEISMANLETVPRELAVGQRLVHRIDESGVRRPEDTRYKAIVKLDQSEMPLVIGAQGKAKILVQRQPLSSQVRRFLARTFKTII